MSGKIYLFEGADGSGKDTQANLLKKYLADEFGEVSVVMGFPTRGNIGKFFRKEVLEKGTITNKLSMIGLLLSDMVHVKQETIDPIIANGHNVILTRSHISTFVYQVMGLNEELVEVNANLISSYIKNGYLVDPDTTFYLQLDADTLVKRIDSRGEVDLFEGQSIREHCNRVEYYDHLLDVRHFNGAVRDFDLVDPSNVIVIDGSKSVEDIHNEVIINV